MIGEAPLWGDDKSYIYNPATPMSQFFYKSDLEYVLNIQINDKQGFIDQCNEIGLLIIDISPFALNLDDTRINYQRKTRENPNGLASRQYLSLLAPTIPLFLEEKIKVIRPKCPGSINVFYRYSRVKKHLNAQIADVLTRHNLINHSTDISDICKQGGGIDRIKFKQIVKLDNNLLAFI